jgi:hypothetical protein
MPSVAAPTPYSWSQSLEPLEPDRCEDDPCAVCAYFHKKRRALAGHTSRIRTPAGSVSASA